MKPLFNKDRSINLPGYVATQEIMPGLLPRIGAFAIDLYLGVLIFLLPFNNIIMGFASEKPNLFGNASMSPSIFIVSSFFFFMMFFYLVLSQYALGQSIGMMILRIRVKSKKVGGIHFWQACVRNLYLFPFFPLGIVWSLEIFHLFFFGYRFFERISGTYATSSVRVNIAQQI